MQIIVLGRTMTISISLKIGILMLLVLVTGLGCETTLFPEEPPATGRWEWINPKPQGMFLWSVWVAPDGAAYAVGNGGVFMRYDGAQWVHLPSGTNTSLYTIWGTSSENIYAGGAEVLMRYDGRQWSYYDLSADVAIRSIWGTSDDNIFAVGSERIDGDPYHNGIILHYDGAQWSVIHRNHQARRFFDVFGLPSGEIYTVSCYSLYIFNGTGWEALPGSPGGDGIWATSPDNIFVNNGTNYIHHYNNGSWTSTELNGMGVTSDAIWGRSSTEVYIVGVYGTVFVFNGSDWIPMHSTTAAHLFSVAGYGETGLIAVGSSGATQHFDGTEWRSGTRGSVSDMFAVWGNSSDNIFFAGASDSIYHYDGIEVRGIHSNLNNTINDMWGFAGDTLFAVGLNGSIAMFDGTRCSSMDSGTDTHFRGVWGTSPSNVFAVGSHALLHYNGKSWQPMDVPGHNHYFSSVWGSSSTNVFAPTGVSGDGFGIYHYNGDRWTLMAGTDTMPGLHSIHGTSSDNIVTAGKWGHVFQFDGNSWNTLNTNVDYYFRGAFSFSRTNIFVVGGKEYGSAGIMIQLQGDAWQMMEDLPRIGFLNDVFGTPEGDVFIAGNSGTVLRYVED